MAGKILVVGATGNIGSSLVAALADKRADVRGLAHSDGRVAAVVLDGHPTSHLVPDINRFLELKYDRMGYF